MTPQVARASLRAPGLLDGGVAPDEGQLPDRRAEARAFLSAALDRHAAHAGLLAVTVPAPLVPVERALVALPGPSAVLWSPPSGPSLAGAGVAFRVDVRGALDPARVRAESDAFFSSLRSATHPSCPAPAPRLHGGLAFAPGAADGPAWHGLGDGAFVLPRASYGCEGASSWFTLVLSLADRASAAARARALDELDASLARLAAESHRPPSSMIPTGAGSDDRVLRPQAAPPQVNQLDRATWRALIDAIQVELVAGRFEKIVAARQAGVELSAPIDVADVLGRLAPEAPGCTRFAFAGDDAVFLGATPERLVALRDRRVETEALAGSIAAATPDADARLLGSAKDLDEHACVVRDVVARLAPLCEAVVAADHPEVRALRHVLHLHTPIDGRLREAGHVLDLVAALHPTPAVAGLPARPAVEFLHAHEPAPRGWYAGPVGWFDRDGDGEFAVALRSGLVAGRRATIFAGAGIVRGSDADREYEETALKQRSLLAALGARLDPQGA